MHAHCSYALITLWKDYTEKQLSNTAYFPLAFLFKYLALALLSVFHEPFMKMVCGT